MHKRDAELQSAYDQGYIDGMFAYAYMKDGVYYVGTTGKTYDQALKDRTKNFNFNIPMKEVEE